MISFASRTFGELFLLLFWVFSYLVIEKHEFIYIMLLIGLFSSISVAHPYRART